MNWLPAPDISTQVTELVEKLELDYIDPTRLICFRSTGSVAYARARIWSLPKIWQLALSIEAHYVIEVLSEKFDGLSADDRTRVLIHELMHIPKTFSGSLVPHHGRFHAINHRSVEVLFRQYQNAEK
jgi:predicted metallopeptidase